MKTSIWGPAAWKFLHAATFAYPDDPTEKHKEDALKLFQSLASMLPCGDCCVNYSNEFSIASISKHLHSKDALSRWLVDLHNRVNIRLGKPTLTYDEVAALYPDDTCDLTCYDAPPQSRTFLYICIIAVLVGIVVLVRIRAFGGT
jgi:hypothetical protein